MYRLDIFWKDVPISRWDTYTSTAEEVYDYCSNDLLREGMENGLSLTKQRDLLVMFCNDIYNMRINKKKISSEKHMMFLSAFFSLHKMNHTSTRDQYIHLKHKKKIRPRNEIHRRIS